MKLFLEKFSNHLFLMFSRKISCLNKKPNNQRVKEIKN